MRAQMAEVMKFVIDRHFAVAECLQTNLFVIVPTPIIILKPITLMIYNRKIFYLNFSCGQYFLVLELFSVFCQNKEKQERIL